MGVLDTVKDMLVPDTRRGVELECTDCGATFEEPLDRCPECGSANVKEVGGFDMAPDT
jgi:rRNA maturation endonuclease Nob1